MLNIQEPDDIKAPLEDEDQFLAAQSYTPRWSGCAGWFSEGGEKDSRKNGDAHFHKHVVIGREWDEIGSPEEYLTRAAQHLDDLNEEAVLEFCQRDDLAVVKYNLDTGELGIARRDDGLIKTFFRPNDIYYILRKVDAGYWGEPDIVDGYEHDVSLAGITGDSQKTYLFDRLEALALELPPQALAIVATVAEGEDPNHLGLLLARFGECRFLVFELLRRILTEEQSDHVFSLRKKIVGAVASFEAVERYRSEQLIEWTKASLDTQTSKQESLWREATESLDSPEEFENSLAERELIGYALLELKILQLHGRMLPIDLTIYEQRVRRSDITLRSIFYHLAQRFKYRSVTPVSPESFFWCSMAKNLD